MPFSGGAQSVRGSRVQIGSWGSVISDGLVASMNLMAAMNILFAFMIGVLGVTSMITKPEAGSLHENEKEEVEDGSLASRNGIFEKK